MESRWLHRAAVLLQPAIPGERAAHPHQRLTLSIDREVYESGSPLVFPPCFVSITECDYTISVAEIIPDADTAARLIAAASGLRRALRRRLNRGEAISNLSDAQRELVRAVRRRPGIRVGEAASELRLAPNTISTLVTSLDQAGWVRRETDVLDARSILLFLTPDAERRVEEWRDRRLAVLTKALHSLSAEEQERIVAALPALQQLVDRVEESE